MTVDEIKQKYFKYAIDVVEGRVVACYYVKAACERNLARFDRDDMYFDADAVDKVVNFCQHLKLYEGEWAGQYMKLQPWQLNIIVNTFGWKWKKNGYRVTRTLYFEVARKNAKALSIDTPIPTPDGWRTMGSLKEGDYVFGADGKPTKITVVTPVMFNHDCYRVTFEDGESVIADADHNWYVKTKKGKECVKTTHEMLDYLHKRNDGKGVEYRYRVPMQKPVEYSERELPIDPYLLGVWLADGSSAKPQITFNDYDTDILSRVTSILGETNVIYCKKNSKAKSYTYYGERNGFNFLKELRGLNLINNKHIPDMYLRASIEQRMQLLQGIMDCDGFVSKRGQCVIEQVNHNLGYDISELLSSLGIKNNKSVVTPTLYGKPCKDVLRLEFWTDKTKPCVTLKRKYDRLKDNLTKRMLWKSITKIEKVDSVPVKCIAVDNNDHLYLFGKNYTVTHNSTLCAALLLYMMIADGEASAQVILAANSAKQASLCFDMCTNLLKSIDPKWKHFKKYRDSIKFEKAVSSIKVVAADASKLDGLNCHAYLCDELHEAPDGSVYNVLDTSTGARRQPLAIASTTAGFDLTSFCYQYRDYNIKIIKEIAHDDTLQAWIYTMDEGDDWTDEKNWIKSNPGIDVSVSRDNLRSKIERAQKDPTQETNIRTKFCNEWCTVRENNFIPLNYVMDSMKDISLDDWKDKEISVYMGIDLASSCDIACVSAMWEYEGKYYFKNWYYLPEIALKESPNKEMYRQWASQKELIITPGNSTDYDYIEREILRLCGEFFVPKIHYDPWQSAFIIQHLVSQGLPCVPYGQKIGNITRPGKELQVLFRNGNVVMDRNQATLYMYQCSLAWYDVHDNLMVKKIHPETDKIDGVIAQIMALGCITGGEVYDNSISAANF